MLIAFTIPQGLYIGGILVLFVACVLLLNYIVTPYMIASTFFEEMFSKKDTSGAYNSASENSPWFDHLRIIRQSVENLKQSNHETLQAKAFDHKKLSGELYHTNKSRKGTVLLFHEMFSNGKREWSALTINYLDLGYDVLIVDQRAHNDSEGEFTTLGILESKDVITWCLKINELYGNTNKLFLHGNSLGAASIALSLGNGLPHNVDGVILESCFLNGYTAVYPLIASSYGDHRTKNIYKVLNKKMLKKFGGNLDIIDCAKAINESEDIPMLFIAGSADGNMEAVTNELYDNCLSSYKDKVIINGATHGECYYRDNETYMEHIKKLLDK